MPITARSRRAPASVMMPGVSGSPAWSVTGPIRWHGGTSPLTPRRNRDASPRQSISTAPRPARHRPRRRHPRRHRRQWHRRASFPRLWRPHKTSSSPRSADRAMPATPRPPSAWSVAIVASQAPPPARQSRSTPGSLIAPILNCSTANPPPLTNASWRRRAPPWRHPRLLPRHGGMAAQAGPHQRGGGDGAVGARPAQRQ